MLISMATNFRLVLLYQYNVVYMGATVAKVVCHNLDHETLVLCRELQNPNDSGTFCSCNRLFGIPVLVIHQREGFIVAVAVTIRMTGKDSCSLLRLKISCHVPVLCVVLSSALAG